MNRRQFLGVATTISVAGTGCLGISATGAGTSERPRIELGEVDQIAEDHEIEIDVSVTKPLVTRDHPAIVRITITNEGPDRTLPSQDSQHTGEGEPVNDLLIAPYEEEESKPHGLILRLASVTDESDEPDDGDGRWSVDSPDGTGAVGAGQWTFPGGKTIAQRFRLLDDAASGGYYPPGTYRFGSEFTFRSVSTDDIVDEFDWDFSLVCRRAKDA